MNLEQFAQLAGVSLVKCDPQWGGTIGYTEKDYPKSMVCGFRTKSAAYTHWAENEFGAQTSKALLALFREQRRSGEVK